MIQHALLSATCLVLLSAGEVSRTGSSQHSETTHITCATNQAVSGELRKWPSMQQPVQCLGRPERNSSWASAAACRSCTAASGTVSRCNRDRWNSRTQRLWFLSTWAVTLLSRAASARATPY
jgi:hypothetical protein